MTTLTEMVAAVVVHSSAAAFSHFGVTLDMPPEPPAHAAAPADQQRVVARTPHQTGLRIEKAAACPDAQRAHVVKA